MLARLFGTPSKAKHYRGRKFSIKQGLTVLRVSSFGTEVSICVLEVSVFGRYKVRIYVFRVSNYVFQVSDFGLNRPSR